MREKERGYSRLRRGMVFTYNINPDVDKRNVPPITIRGGKERKDFKEYGERYFVIVSSDDVCQEFKTVCIVPFTTYREKEGIQKSDNHVYFNYLGEVAEVLCEHIYTVNATELELYSTTLNDCVMSEIDKKLAMNLSIPYEKVFRDRASLKDIENIILAIVQKRVDEVRAEQITAAKAQGVDIDDAVLRISDTLSNLFDVKIDELKKQVSADPDPNTLNIDKNYYSKPDQYMQSSMVFPELEEASKSQGNKREESYQQPKSSNTKKRSYSGKKPTKRKYTYDSCGNKSIPNIEQVRVHNFSNPWTQEEIVEFMHDYTEYDYNTLMRKYRCDSKVHLQQLKSRLLRKLEDCNV